MELIKEVKKDVKKLLKDLYENEHIYCHITSNLDQDNYFYPRIPKYISDGENTEIERVCVSSTIEGALTAIPNGGSRLENYLEESSNYFKVYIIDTKKLGVSKILKSDELFEKDYVRDAEITKEHWVLEPILVPEEDTFIIRLEGWDEEARDVVPYEIYKLGETDEYEGDYTEAYYDVFDKMIPTICNIIWSDFLTEEVKSGDKIKIDLTEVESSLSREELKEEFLKNNPEISFLDSEYNDDITIVFNKEQNVQELMYTDWYYKHCY